AQCRRGNTVGGKPHSAVRGRIETVRGQLAADAQIAVRGTTRAERQRSRSVSSRHGAVETEQSHQRTAILRVELSANVHIADVKLGHVARAPPVERDMDAAKRAIDAKAGLRATGGGSDIEA